MLPMWIKTAAALAVFAAGGLLGMEYARRIDARCGALQDALLLLQLVRIKTERAHSLWLCEIAAAARDGSFQQLQFPESIREDEDRQAALHRFLCAADEKHLLGAETDLVQNALECAVTRAETAVKLDYYIQLLQQRLEGVHCAAQNNKAFFARLGWMGGALLAVILW